MVESCMEGLVRLLRFLRNVLTFTHKTCQKCKAPRMIVAKNPRYKLYWLGNENGTGDAGIFIEQIK